ncbi:cupin domain-containing protein (plasmid) [Halorussus limi]|uniref:Cupin domain-containing protein n=1 Tax=Halorussus limi TaxID=2938695 RepID=A0A8U0I0S9_9EURY|nr:cupin domain-containing protein [Halorussus limi]UPV76759.1 cupin domain-containing protein [Halorussus limi]
MSDFDDTNWTNPSKIDRPYEGIERRVLSYTDELMLVHYTVAEGAVFPEHEHDETVQAVFVIDGCIELFGDREGRLAAGDSFVVHPGVRHGIEGVAPRTQLIDAFNPPIERYRE